MGKMYKTVVRPAMMYGAYACAVKEANNGSWIWRKWGCWDGWVESTSWTELGMKELEGQRRWEKYPRKCWKVGWSGPGVGMYWEEKTNMWAREWWWWRYRWKEGDEDQSGDGWTASGTTCLWENCQEWKRKTELNEASNKKHRPHLKVGNDAEEEEDTWQSLHQLLPDAWW